MADVPAPDRSFGPWARALAVVVLLATLGGLFVAAGTQTPNPELNDHPGGDEVGPDPDAYVGQEVSLNGRVVRSDPLRVEVEYGTGETFRVTVTGVDPAVADGDVLNTFGTLEDEGTLAADRVIVREPWEMWYMYLVSFAGGLWVLTRTVRRWRVDRQRLAVVPREEPLSIGDDSDA
jgi:hypothetical protein